MGLTNGTYFMGAILTILVLGLISSQQAEAGIEGSTGNIIVDKFIQEGSSTGTLTDPELVEEGDTIVFDIVVDFNTFNEASVGSILMNDLLPDGLTYTSHLNFGQDFSSDYNPNTGDWTISGLFPFEGSSSTLRIEATVDEGSCGKFIENKATLEGWTNGEITINGNTDSTDDMDSSFLEVIGQEGEICEKDTSQDVLYSCSKDDDILRIIDPNDASTVQEIQMIPPEGLEIDKCTGLASNSANQLYAILTMFAFETEGSLVTPAGHNDRNLVTINPTTGQVTVIGPLFPTGFAGIAFGQSGTLFGVTGDGSSNPETLYTIDTTDATTNEVCDLGNGDDGESIAFSTADDFLYHASGYDVPGPIFERIDDTAGESCPTTDISYRGSLGEENEEIFGMTYWDTHDLFIVSTIDDELHELTRPQSPGGLGTLIGDLDHTSKGLAFIKILSETGGGDDHEPPTIGKLSDGVVQAVVNGISIDGQSWTVTKDYHQEFELLQMLTSPHTISNEIYCNEGYQECNHITVAFLNIDSFFPDTVMTVSADKDHQGNWNISWSDPQNFIYDPDDPSEPKDITFTAQVIDNKRIGTSFTIDFRNKDTGQLKLGIQVRDMEGGVRNFYFNEGVMFNDADAYPAVMSSYDAPLEVESLCLNEDPDYRNSCAFAQKRASETQKA